jgi:hypothetical protein
VLWLGELRRHVDAEDGAALLRHLANLLDGEGHLVIGTVWPRDWEAYTTAAGTALAARVADGASLENPQDVARLHAVARVDGDVARKEHEVTGLLLAGGNLGQAGPRLLAVGGSRTQDILAVDEGVDPADEPGAVQSVLPVVAVAARRSARVIRAINAGKTDFANGN